MKIEIRINVRSRKMFSQEIIILPRGGTGITETSARSTRLDMAQWIEMHLQEGRARSEGFGFTGRVEV